MVMWDELGPIFEDQDFAELFSWTGQPGISPAQLALVTVMQYIENLTDRQAADAVRARIDWKNALGLELEDAGFHYSVLSEFRTQLIEGEKEDILQRYSGALRRAEPAGWEEAATHRFNTCRGRGAKPEHDRNRRRVHAPSTG